MTATKTTTTVFVYGTLKQGFGNHRLLADSEFIGSAVSHDRFEMKTCGFPCLIKPREADASQPLACVAGELYEVDDATLEQLDRLEGNGSMYQREKINFEITDAKYEVHEAWVYIWLRGTDRLAPVTLDHWEIEPLLPTDSVTSEPVWDWRPEQD